MQAQALRAPALPATPAAAQPADEARPAAASRRRRERLLLFLIAWAAYTAIGLYAILHLHLIKGDGEARLAHAYFAWWDDPAKLAAIGSYWPPLETVVLLPFAAIKPLATSLVALPLSSALFGALLLVVLDAALAEGGLRRSWRWPILAAFGLNPLVLFFAVNGMAESLYLFLMAAAILAFVRWLQRDRWADLALAGVALALAVLARFEVAAWLVPMMLAMVAVQRARRAPWARLEASLLVVLAPVAYALAAWTFINWTVFGDPFSYLSAGLGNVSGSSFASHVAQGAAAGPAPAPGPAAAAAGQAAGAAGQAVTAVPPSPPGVLHQTHDALLLQLTLFPPMILAAVTMLIVGIRRRRIPALFLAGALLTTGVLTVGLLVVGSGGGPLQLRYNMRSMPIVLIAVGWGLAALSPRRRSLAGAATLVALVLAVPATGAVMWNYVNSNGEHAFVDGMLSGRSQDRILPSAGTGLSLIDQRDMARFIERRVRGRDAILTDDAQSFGVMLLTGRPERFLDRIDVGDEHWTVVRDHPFEHGIRYFLVQLGALEGLAQDRILDAYPSLIPGKPPPPGFRVVHRNQSFSLYALRGARAG